MKKVSVWSASYVMQLVVANMFQGPEGLHAIGEVYKHENEKSYWNETTALSALYNILKLKHFNLKQN